MPHLRLPLLTGERLVLAGVGLLWAFGSLGVTQKYLGTVAALVILAIGAPAAPLVAMACRALTGELAARPRLADGLALAILLAAVLLLIVVYPHADVQTANAGFDRDDAATIGARGFLDGRNPYGTRTYLGGLISQLPVLFVVAMPFVWVTGSSAYALVVALPLLYLLLRAVAGTPLRALGWLAGLLSAPFLLRDYLTGGDLLTNLVLVAGAICLAWRWRGRSAAWLAAAGVLLGLSFATRVNTVLVLLPLLVMFLRGRGLRVALLVGAVAAAVLAAVAGPLLLSSGGRQALTMNDKLATIPGGAPLVLALVVALGAVMALRQREWTLSAVLGQAAVTQAALLVAVVVHSSVDAGRPDFTWLISGYGTFAWGLLVVAAAARHAAEAPVVGR